MEILGHGDSFFLSTHDNPPQEIMISSSGVHGPKTQLCRTRVHAGATSMPQGEVCFNTQSETAFSASGAMVSSMAPYSVGEPVGQCCKRWFKPGNAVI
jgi:hypothetical protein